MYSKTLTTAFCVFVILAHLPICPVSAQAHLYCQNCFYGPRYCDPNTNRCTYGCREGWKGDQCIEQCITKGCKHCEDQPNGIEQCTSCLSSGYYGPLCNLRCSANCLGHDGDDTCDHFGNCIFGCVAPYIGSQCTEQNCPYENCDQCAIYYNGRLYCHKCLNGYYWVPTIEKCVPCTANCLYGTPDCDTETGQCKSGKCKEGWVGNQCNIKCDINECSVCKETNENVYCVTCKRGYFPNPENDKKTCVPCSSNCGGNCNRQTGECLSGCKQGYYGSNCDQQCNINNCDECAYDDPVKEDKVLCTKCSNGYYYDMSIGCQACPVNCLDGENTTCQFLSGNCEHGCKNGYYGPKCLQRCSENCLNNVCNSIGSCDCKTGWFGHRCDRSCPIHCLNCDEYVNGVCSACEAGWWGSTCDIRCSTNCKPNSFSNFVYCNKTNGHCREGCNPDWYGDNCTSRCSSACVASSCNRQSGECTIGCTVNTYGKFCNQSCPINCKNPSSRIESACNSTDGRCLYGCSNGFYGEYCNLPCSQNCFDDRCDVNTGDCLQGCKQGYTGKKCDQRCSAICPTTCGNNCLYNICDSVTNTCTSGCHQGWYGTRCEKICSDKCLDRVCEQQTGNCKEGCQQGRWGAKCEQVCSDKCQTNQCDQVSGSCGACKPGYYGSDCQQTCTTNCLNTTCEKWNGRCFRCGIGRQGDYCTQGCPSGYHGENCEMPCGNCKNGLPCYTADGVCPFGCDIGWTGPTCNQALQTSNEKSSDPNKAMQIAIGCAVGGVFCCLVIIVFVCWYRRRKLTHKKKVEEPSVEFRNTQVIINSPPQPETSTPPNAQSDQTSNQSSGSEHSQSDPLLGDPNSSQIKLLDVIREGQFYTLVKGEVIKHGDQRPCCVKLLKLTELKEERCIYRLTLESEILAQCGSHKNIISMIKTYQNTDIYCVAIDNCVQTGILYYLRRLPSVSSESGSVTLDPVNIYKITQFVTEICSAVTHLHDLKIIHRALRAGHVYLTNKHVTKLGDFDWAEWFNPDQCNDSISHRFDLPKNYYHWMSPESCINHEFTYKTDVQLSPNPVSSGAQAHSFRQLVFHQWVDNRRPMWDSSWRLGKDVMVVLLWSLGLLFWEVFNLARKTPYLGLNVTDHRQAIQDGIRPAKPPLAHFSLYRLMKGCWRYDPADRPECHQILSQLQTIQASTWTTVQQLQ